MSINLLHVDGIVICSGDGLVYEVPRKFLFTVIPSVLPCMFRLNGWLIKGAVSSAVARPNSQPRQAGVARGVQGHAPTPARNFEL